MMFEQWQGFKTGKWQDEIDLRDFIHLNYTPYDGDGSFLSGPTERTNKCMEKVNALLKEESEKGGGRKTIKTAVGLNTAAVLYLSGKARTLKDGYNMAIEAIDSGKALKKLEEIQKVSGEL